MSPLARLNHQLSGLAGLASIRELDDGLAQAEKKETYILATASTGGTYYPVGVALATLHGQILAEAICGDRRRFDLLRSITHRGFPGGAALRPLLLAFGMTWYAMRDRF